MKVLVVVPELPAEPLSGLGLQITHLSKEMAKRHELTTLGLRPSNADTPILLGGEIVAVEPPDRRAGARLRTWLRATARGIPFPVAAVGDPISRAVSELTAARRFDVAHVASSILAGTAPALGGTPAVLAALDAWHLNAAVARRLAPPLLKPLYALEARRVRRFESHALRPYRGVVVVSPRDAGALERLDPSLEIEVIPNGVDSDRFAPSEEVATEADHLVFSGTMSWPPNVEAARFLAREVLPRVRAARPDAHLSIVGRNPAREVLALGRLPGVRVTGEVADMRPWLWRAQAYVCPMVSGTGIKNKLLEALACGTPAVATPLACEGMEVRSDVELLLAADADRLAAATVRLLGDPRLGERLAAAGRRYVVAAHGWSAVADAYDRIYLEAVGDRAPVPSDRHGPR